MLERYSGVIGRTSRMDEGSSVSQHVSSTTANDRQGREGQSVTDISYGRIQNDSDPSNPDGTGNSLLSSVSDY